MVIKYINFKKLVSLARAGTPIEIDGATYVAKKVEDELLGCCHCKLGCICDGDILSVCMALESPTQSYYLERYDKT